jgi:hypothetical protein
LSIFSKAGKPNKREELKLCALVPLWQNPPKTGITAQNLQTGKKTLLYKNRHTSDL